MNTFRTMVAGSLLLFGAAACADLEVTNPNNPGREVALTSAGDVESLIQGSFGQWLLGEQWDGDPTATPAFALSTQAFQWTSTAANFGILTYSRLPRSEIRNTVTHREYPVVDYSWNQNYRALSAVSTGLRAIAANEDWADELGDDGVLRAKIFGKFMQGLSHASIAVLYDKGFIIDETVAVLDESGAPAELGEPKTYTEVMNAALGYFDAAIAMASSPAAGEITIPADWMFSGMEGDTDMESLVQIAHSLKARYRASVARNPTERAAVNWAQVMADAQAGVTADWLHNQDQALTDLGVFLLAYPTLSTWGQMPLFIIGMADQSGAYQNWLSKPLGARYPTDPYPSGPRVLIRSPDKRFPQGNNEADQLKNQGTCTSTTCPALPYFRYSAATQHNRPERGEWRWSWYRPTGVLQPSAYYTVHPWIKADEMRLLIAEGRFRTGDLAGAATIINDTREKVAGLNATNAAGLNTSCVPKLPNGSCGDLFEMLKWEKRLETYMTGPYHSSWYFDGRGWNDLFEGTPLQWPMPAAEAGVLGLAVTTYGGANEFSAPGSTYGFDQ